MPLYEFHCSDCEEDFEELVRTMSAVDRVRCPNCGGAHVAKRVSSFAAGITGGAYSFSGGGDSSCSTGST